jgi:hypothetical protein
MYFLIKNILKYKSFQTLNHKKKKKKKGRTMRLSTQFRTHQFSLKLFFLVFFLHFILQLFKNKIYFPSKIVFYSFATDK